MTKQPTDSLPTFMHNPLLKHLRENNRFDGDLDAVQKELRERRQEFLGSHLLLSTLVYENNVFSKEAVDELSDYLANRTARLWALKHPDAEEFCFRFYVLAITFITYPLLARACVDNIIQLASCLVRSRTVFMVAAKGMIPEDMWGELYDFVEAYDDNFYGPSFEDAVLGAVCVLLGVIEDPTADVTINDTEEDV